MVQLLVLTRTWHVIECAGTTALAGKDLSCPANPHLDRVRLFGRTSGLNDVRILRQNDEVMKLKQDLAATAQRKQSAKSAPRRGAPPEGIAAYFAAQPATVRTILQRIRTEIKRVAPEATEKLSYGMPTFLQSGVLIHYGAFKQHIGLFPPVRDERLKRAAARYAGPKGNLKFPLDQPIPYALIGRIVKSRLRENQQRVANKKAQRH